MSADLAAALQEGASRARRCGVDRLELRYQAEHSGTMRAIDGVINHEDDATIAGIGVRAILGAASGHAGRAFDPSSTEDPARAIDEAIAAACAEVKQRAATLGGRYVDTEEEPARGHYEPPDSNAAWTTSAELRRAMLTEATRALRTRAGSEGRLARAHATVARSQRVLATSDGTLVSQSVSRASGGLSILVELDGEREERTTPLFCAGDAFAGGLEGSLAERAEALADEARALVRAPLCPSEMTSVILGPEALGVQLYQTVGRVLAGDRILGEDGRSFVTPDSIGRMRYGSTRVDLVTDARLPGAVGSHGWDDEGVAGRRTPLVQRGQLVGVLSTRGLAPRFGLTRSAGCFLAPSFDEPPGVCASNLLLEAVRGGPTLEEIVADTAHGLLLGRNRSASVDDLGLAFELGCELAWEIRGGRRTRLVRRPSYRSRTPQFFGACDLVGGPESVRMHGLAVGARGTRAVGIGGPPARFRAIEIGPAR